MGWKLLVAAIGLSNYASGRAMPVEPNEICLLTDHESLPHGACSMLGSAIRTMADSMKGSSQQTILKSFMSYIHKKKISLKANHVIPCLNRHYACEMGYSFFMPASPKLTIANENIQFSEMPVELRRMTRICEQHNVSLPKGWHGDSYTETKRSHTWCKVLLLDYMLSRFKGCKVVVFLDADLLLIPPNQIRADSLQSLSAFHAATLEMTQKQRDFLGRGKVASFEAYEAFQRDDHKRFMKYGFQDHFMKARLESMRANCAGGGVEGQGCERALHEQDEVATFLSSPEKLFFLSTTTLGLTFGHEQWSDPTLQPKNPNEVFELYHRGARSINNVNNTVHSTSFIVVKNEPRARFILKDWWSSVDPLHASRPGLVGQLGEPLAIYRTAWAHEQRVFDDYVADVYAKEVAVSSRALDYNTPAGLFAQHYFYKEAHQGQYLSVAAGIWAPVYKDKHHKRPSHNTSDKCVALTAYWKYTERIDNGDQEETQEGDAIKVPSSFMASLIVRSPFSDRKKSKTKPISSSQKPDSLYYRNGFVYKLVNGKLLKRRANPLELRLHSVQS
mmetsp:Transcript_62562/g.117661  ORF Transcript_62562/g.117661 Transcript_62562/m.117661 type:complete len:560 (-) Transcript_62562:210-1889(-)